MKKYNLKDEYSVGTVSYSGRVISSGNHSIPSAYMELMYSPEVNIRTALKNIAIKKKHNLTKAEKYSYMISIILITALAGFLTSKIKERKSREG